MASENPPSSATSPKMTKKHSLADIRFPFGNNAVTAHGCDHLKQLSEDKRDETLKKYTAIIQTISKPTSITARTSHGASGTTLDLRPTYLCLQCSNVASYDQRDAHDKTHTFCVESSQGHLYCRLCADIIYAPPFEDVRLLSGKKRKHSSYMSDVDAKILAANALATPCRARGLRGLYNMGQTCFMSVVLQSLIHNPFVRAYYLSGEHRSSECEREACTSCALDDIFTEFHSTEKAEGYGAVAMLQGSWKGGGSLAGYQQQDAHEYLQFILNSLHAASLEEGEKEDKAEDCQCVIHRSFCGLFRSTVTCSKCKNVTTAMDAFMDLSLEMKPAGAGGGGAQGILKKKKNGKDANGTSGAAAEKAEKAAPNTMDLAECLDRFTSPEMLPASEYRCRECDGQQNATKRLSLWRLPPVLPVHLKRFSHSKSLSSSVKLETKVNFPIVLDLQPYTSRARAKKGSDASNGTAANGPDANGSESPSPSKAVYELSSVVVHKGKMDSGHYINYAREGDEWFLFDDSKVVLVEEKEVLGAEAYMLFYVIREID